MNSLSFFLNKIESLRARAKGLTHLSREVTLPLERDLKKEQWESLNSQLFGISNNLLHKIRIHTDRFLADSENEMVKIQMVEGLGNLEMEVTQSYIFYDTYMDLLTQRLSKPIGELLHGCDAIAMDGISRGFLADISLPPIVYCDRGFGASTCREGVNILPGVPNPMQFIAIPYSRLVEKYNLISIYHEVGHQTLVKLNLVKLLQQIFDEQLMKTGASGLMRSLFTNWVKELGPDYWAFCLTGMAQTCSLRDILFLPKEQSTYISAVQQHPPPYLRFLMSVHWCRQLWGSGDWDDWEGEWKEKYSVNQLDAITKDLILNAEKMLPLASRIFCNTKFKKLGNKPISSLFTMEYLEPDKLKKMVAENRANTKGFKQEPIGVQLAVFRLMRENRKFKQSYIDTTMTEWLKTITN